MTRVPEPDSPRAHQSLPVPRSQTEMHPEWETPRLLARAGSSGEESVPFPPHQASAGARRPPHATRAARPSPGPLVSATIVGLLGAATGAAGACLLVLLSPATAERLVAPVDAAVSAIAASAPVPGDAAKREKSVAVALIPPAAPRSMAAQTRGSEAKDAVQPPPSPLPEASAAPVGAVTAPGTPSSTPASTAAGDHDELTALLQRTEHELAEQRLEQPAGDNALDTYRQLAARWPHVQPVAHLGRSIALAFWTLGNNAKAAGHWDQALHYLEIVNTLPPIPLGDPPESTGSSGAR